MATTNTGSARLDRMNADDANRRRVTTRNGRVPPARPAGRAPAGSKPALVNVQIGGPRRRTKTRKRRSMKTPSISTIIYSIIAAGLMIVAIVFQTMASILLAVASLTVAVVVARADARKPRSAPPPPPRKRAPSRGSGAGAKRNGSPGTGTSGGGQKPPAKRRPAGSREPVCGKACRESPKPKSTCRCRATECHHGKEVPVTGK